MRLFKAAILGVVLVSVGAMAANAADQSPTPTHRPPQTAALPGTSGVASGQTAASAGHWVWVPRPTSPYVTNGATGVRTDHGQFYSKQGFGPSPN
jgi:hypothetical protein